MNKYINVSITLNTFFLIFYCSYTSFAQNSNIRKQYFLKYKNDAIKEMISSGIPASITLAQAALESGNGTSKLAIEANNHFGIKCHADWEGPYIRIDDDEKNECFRKYTNVYESFKDHSNFLKNRDRYKFLFEYELTDYKSWAIGLSKAGYATNPKYADLLIKIIEDDSLYLFDDKNYKEESTHKNDEKRKIYTFNGIKFVIAKELDTWNSLAEEFDLQKWQLPKYNDNTKTSKIFKGDTIYIQPKKRKGKSEFYIVKKNDTFLTISQKEGIKLKHLLKKNNLSINSKIIVGDKLYLKNPKKQLNNNNSSN